MAEEAATRANLDVGLFASPELMRAEDVQGVIQQLGEELRGVKLGEYGKSA
jgi:hypothetical protein